jgi:hypothetical protein
MLLPMLSTEDVAERFRYWVPRCGAALELLEAKHKRSLQRRQRHTVMRLVRALSVPVAVHLPLLESPEEVLSSNLA